MVILIYIILRKTILGLTKFGKKLTNEKNFTGETLGFNIQ